MKAAHKRALYLDAEIEEILAQAPQKKVSERANELMRKGLQKEKEEAVAKEYQRYAESLVKDQRGRSKENPKKMTSTQLSYRLLKAAEPTPDMSGEISGDTNGEDDEDLI